MALVYPLGAEIGQAHPVALGDGPGEQRDIPAGENFGRGETLDLLPLGEMAVALAAHQREEGKGEHVGDHVRVSFEHAHEVVDEADLLGDYGN